MTDGRVYIDFLAEAGVLALGYNHPALVAAVQRTSDSVQATADIDSRGNDCYSDTATAEAHCRWLVLRAHVEHVGDRGRVRDVVPVVGLGDLQAEVRVPPRRSAPPGAL